MQLYQKSILKWTTLKFVNELKLYKNEHFITKCTCYFVG